MNINLKKINIILVTFLISLSIIVTLNSFYWNDEAWSINLTFFNWKDFYLYFYNANDLHPFFYFFLLKLFTSIEFLSIEFYKIINLSINLIFAGIFIWISYRQKKESSFYFLLLLFFLNPISIYMIDEIRQYSVALFLVGSIILLTNNLLTNSKKSNFDILLLSILISCLSMTNYVSALAVFIILINLFTKFIREKQFSNLFLLISIPIVTILLTHTMILGHISKNVSYKKDFETSIYFMFLISATTLFVYIKKIQTIFIYKQWKTMFFKSILVQQIIFYIFLLGLIYTKITFNFLNIGNTYIMMFSAYLVLILSIKKEDITEYTIIGLLAVLLIGMTYNIKSLFNPKLIESNRVCPTKHLDKSMCSSNFTIIEWDSGAKIYEQIIHQLCKNNPNVKKLIFSKEINNLYIPNGYILTRQHYKNIGIKVSDGLFYKSEFIND